MSAADQLRRYAGMRDQPISSVPHSQVVRAFRDDVQSYCDFVDTWRTTAVRAPFTTLLGLLASLAKSGAAIPFDMADRDVKDVERIDHAGAQAIAGDLSALTGAASAKLMSEHAGSPESQQRVFMLWDDLADIYLDLRHGLDLYSRGDADHLAEAVWQWRFGFENHWGEHLFRALMTIHEIRYRLYME